MLIRISGFFDLLFLFLGINYISGHRYRFHIFDILMFLADLAILDLINSGFVDEKFIFTGYAVMVAYMVMKFHPGVVEFIVNAAALFVYAVIVQLFFAIPAYFAEDPFLVDILVLSANICSCLITEYAGRKRFLWKLMKKIRSHDWLVRGIIFCCGLGAAYLIVTLKFDDSLRITDYIIFGLWTLIICILAVMWQKGRTEIGIKNREMQLQKTYEGSYRDLVQSVRMRQHEFDNHLVALCGVYKTADTVEELIRRQSLYRGELEKHNRYNRLLSLQSPVLAGFLYSKFDRAETIGCRVSYSVKTAGEDQHRIPEYHVIELLGILIDNAVEALEHQEDGQIYVELAETEKEIRIIVRNTSDYVPQGDIVKFTKSGYSSKGAGRGLGLASLALIVNQYDGELKVCNEEWDLMNWLVFQIEIGPE